MLRSNDFLRADPRSRSKNLALPPSSLEGAARKGQEGWLSQELMGSLLSFPLWALDLHSTSTCSSSISGSQHRR